MTARIHPRRRRLRYSEPRFNEPRPDRTGLLQSIVEVARSVFSAAAASVFLLDEDTDELVFEAVAGEGADSLVGQRFPSSTGLAGWVVTSGRRCWSTMSARIPQFARDAAESTGYMPTSIMAAPLIRNGECIGVLSVLDRGTRPRGDLSDVGLIAMLATEVALGLDLLIRLRRRTGEQGSGRDDDDLTVLRRVAERLPTAGEPVGVHGQPAAGNGR